MSFHTKFEEKKISLEKTSLNNSDCCIQKLSCVKNIRKHHKVHVQSPLLVTLHTATWW